MSETALIVYVAVDTCPPGHEALCLIRKGKEILPTQFRGRTPAIAREAARRFLEEPEQAAPKRRGGRPKGES